MIGLEDDKLAKVNGNSKKGWRLIYQGITIRKTISKNKANNWKHWLAWYEENIELMVMEDFKKLDEKNKNKTDKKSEKKSKSTGGMNVVTVKRKGEKEWRLNAEGFDIRKTDSETEANNWKHWLTWNEENLALWCKCIQKNKLDI
jgi:hypothetical protein